MQSESDDSFLSESENFVENLKKSVKFINLQNCLSLFVSGIIDFSSQYGNDNSISYSAINILGKPHKFPEYGDFPECYTMRSFGPWWKNCPSGLEEIAPQDCTESYPVCDFIVVKFDEYVIPEEIHIFETFNPGAIISIWCYCFTIEKWKLLWKGDPQICEKKAREFIPPIKKLSVPTKILRIEFNHSLLDYFTAIDAILLKGTKCIVLSEEEFFDITRLKKGPILQKLETVHFEPRMNNQPSIGEFLKNDLNKFIMNCGLDKDLKMTNNIEIKDVPAIIMCDNSKNILDLPNEILLKIMSLLDLKSLYSASGVCSKFRKISTDPLLYTEVNLKVYWNNASSSLLKSLQKRATLIKKLDVSSCGLFHMITNQDFKDFIRLNGKQLTHLRLNNCKFLNNKCLEVIATNCKSLRELCLRNYISSHETNSRDFGCLAKLTHLERLDMFRSGIDNVAIMSILRNNPNMKHLNLGFSTEALNLDDVCQQLKIYNKQIISLDLWKSHSLTPVGIAALSELKELEEVDLGWCLRETVEPSDSLKLLVQNCTKLKKLFLAAIRGITDRDLENIAKYCANLEQLDLMGIPTISTEMCLRILQNCPQLKLFDLSFCDQLDDVQLMAWQNEFGTSIKRSFMLYAD